MRITDGFLSLPAPVLAIAVVAALGPGFIHTLIAVSIVWWPFYARLVRGEVARLAARPHVEAARLAGVGPIRLAIRHLLPGAVPNSLVAASLDIGNLILTLAALSFLGLGQAAPAPELGADTARNLTYFLQQWWIPVMPGLARPRPRPCRQRRGRRPAQPDEDELGGRHAELHSDPAGRDGRHPRCPDRGDVRAAAHFAAGPGEGATRRTSLGGGRRGRSAQTRAGPAVARPSSGTI